MDEVVNILPSIAPIGTPWTSESWISGMRLAAAVVLSALGIVLYVGVLGGLTRFADAGG